ncbi:hypothetical protein [Pontibacter sp. SGAir0037]|uniref:hypothetical protein n=1 Tax=Pontibacter sp. SGAir0037 TaxID=2571030 RepID=UPI0010CCCCB4|nr:hypothetical protein [Pontibacter sp. SGAir0037]QCR24174.1 hypothetical protein C1N53_18640 [Pontibacter sp. SGAir0037]
MNRTSTSAKSDLTLIALLSMLLAVFILASCSTRVERETNKEADVKDVIATTEQPAVTVASLGEAAEETYFDLIANTSNCLGEDLWIGGKIESAKKLVMTQTGSTSLQKVYEVKELTATGLHSNNSYTLLNDAGTLKAVCDESGVLYIKLAEGPLQLVSEESTKPLTVAYEPVLAVNSEDGKTGIWSCK